MNKILTAVFGLVITGLSLNSWADVASPKLASGQASGKRQHKTVHKQRKAGGTQMTAHDKTQLTNQLSGNGKPGDSTVKSDSAFYKENPAVAGPGGGAGKDKADIYVKGNIAPGTDKTGTMKADTWTKGGITDGSSKDPSKADESFIKMDNGMQKSNIGGVPAVQTNH